MKSLFVSFWYRKRQSRMRPLACVLLALLLLLPACTAHTPTTAPSSSPAFTVLFFNDIHGHLQPFTVKTDEGEKEVGGVARLAALVDKIRSENAAKGVKTFVLIAGDILQGTPMSTIFQGEPDIACFNRMGVNAATIGNHEFDFGLANFQSLRGKASFPFLSANILWKESGGSIADAAVQLPIEGDISLTVIGVTTQDLMTTTNPVNVASLKVKDPVSAAVAAFDGRQGRGPVILLSHCRHATDRATAEALPELAAIIGGHDQILLSPYRRVGPVPIFQAFEKGRFLGRIDFQMDPETGTFVLTGHRYIPITADLPQDPSVEAIVAQYDRKLSGRFKEVIGRADTFLDGEREHIRWQETSLGDFVTDIMRRQTGSRIALLNAGSLRASIHRGDITVTDVFRAMPYANELVTLQLSGKDLKAALSRAYQSKREDEDGGFLHVSGVWVRIFPQGVEKIEVGAERKPLRPDEMYSVVITDFLYAGGDGYAMFKDKPAVHTGLPLRELIVEEIRNQKTVGAEIEGRIVRN